MVSTSRCGRDNPGSNPGHGILFSHVLKQVKIIAIGVALDLSRIFLNFFFLKKTLIGGGNNPVLYKRDYPE